MTYRSLLTAALALAAIAHRGFSQAPALFDPSQNAFHAPAVGQPAVSVDAPPDPASAVPDPAQTEPPGRIHRGAARLWADQKELYRAPFRRSSLKWDAIVLAGTGALLATDRHIERHLPGGNVDLYTNVSNAALGGTAAALALSWGYGL
jgi:hypothetical protein